MCITKSPHHALQLHLKTCAARDGSNRLGFSELADFQGDFLFPLVWQVHGCPTANVKPFVQEVITPGLMRLRLGALLMPTEPLYLTLRGRSRFSGGECSRMDCYRCLDTLLIHPRGGTWAQPRVL
jgi:hypothetical protein